MTSSNSTLDATITDQLWSWLQQAYPERLRPATGQLDRPFIDPGAGYEDILWDWDAFFSLLGLQVLADQDPRIGQHAAGCVESFIQRQGPDGSIPYAIMAGGKAGGPTARADDSPRNSSKPLLAQFACLAQRCGGADDSWLADVRDALGKHVDHWFDSQMTGYGLLCWRSHRGSGADNHPAYFQRPHNSVADPYLNSMMVLECQAMAAIHARTGGDARPWQQRAEELSAKIEQWLWDPIDGTYYAIDVGSGDPGPVRTPRDWAVPLKIRSWVMCMPLVAGVAAPERAERVLREHFLPADQLRSPYGLRSLAACEPSYRIFANYNPSDWCGPIWVVSNYLCLRGMQRYGFTSEAATIAAEHLACLAADARAHGKLHEYYHPETGEGMTHPGFVNWNTCALLIAQELSENEDLLTANGTFLT